MKIISGGDTGLIKVIEPESGEVQMTIGEQSMSGSIVGMCWKSPDVLRNHDNFERSLSNNNNIESEFIVCRKNRQVESYFTTSGEKRFSFQTGHVPVSIFSFDSQEKRKIVTCSEKGVVEISCISLKPYRRYHNNHHDTNNLVNDHQNKLKHHGKKIIRNNNLTSTSITTSTNTVINNKNMNNNNNNNENNTKENSMIHVTEFPVAFPVSVMRPLFELTSTGIRGGTRPTLNENDDDDDNNDNYTCLFISIFIVSTDKTCRKMLFLYFFWMGFFESCLSLTVAELWFLFQYRHYQQLQLLQNLLLSSFLGSLCHIPIDLASLLDILEEYFPSHW